MRTEDEIRSALSGWKVVLATGSDLWSDDLDEETRADLADMQRHAKHHVDALEWVLKEGK